MLYSQRFPIGNKVVLRRDVNQEDRFFERGARGTVIENYDGEAFTVRMENPAGYIHVAPDWVDLRASEIASAFRPDWFAPMRACANILTIAIALAAASAAVIIDDMFDPPPRATGTETQRAFRVNGVAYLATFRREHELEMWSLHGMEAYVTGKPVTFALGPQ